MLTQLVNRPEFTMAHPNPAPPRQHQDAANAIVTDDVSLIRGGPFYRAQEATRLIDANRWNLGRRITFAIALGWLPLVLMTVLFHPAALRSLLVDYRVAPRMLIAVPVLLLGQVVMESRFRLIVQHLREAGVLKPRGLTELDSAISSLLRWRDSIWPELALIAAVYLSVALVFASHVHESRPWALTGEGATHLLPAGWYYAFVSQLVYQFLIGLSLWKWLLWCYFLFRLSRLALQLVPTHPDSHGGIGFWAFPQWALHRILLQPLCPSARGVLRYWLKVRSLPVSSWMLLFCWSSSYS